MAVKKKTETESELMEKLDHFATVAFAELMRSDATQGWSFDSIGRQAYTAAQAMLHHRSESIGWVRQLRDEQEGIE